MSEQKRSRDDVLGERLGRVLRTEERFGDHFERDLIEAIRADVPVERRAQRRSRPFAPSWWRTPVPLRLSPLAGAALAASLTALAVFGERLGRSRAAVTPVAPTPVASVVHDTVHVVRFVFVGDARTVSLVGDFNGWRAEATPLEPAGPARAWVVTLPLARGRYENAFIVDGKRWVADPYAPARADEFDTNSSIVNVGT
jgi:hypothetical protein